MTPEDGDVFSIIERHVGKGDEISLTDCSDLETGLVVRFIPAGERRTGKCRLEMSRHQVASVVSIDNTKEEEEEEEEEEE